MEIKDLKPIIEALIFASDHPITFDRLVAVLEAEDRSIVREALNELMSDYEEADGGLVIDRVAGGYRLSTRTAFSHWIKKLFKTATPKISRAAMESLSIIAYKQPVTRGELEGIRGVDSGGVIKKLMDRRLIKITGRKETPGRPVVYGTTREFLEAFDLKDLSHLPTLKDIELPETDEDLLEGENAPIVNINDDTGEGQLELEARTEDDAETDTGTEANAAAQPDDGNADEEEGVDDAPDSIEETEETTEDMNTGEPSNGPPESESITRDTEAGPFDGPGEEIEDKDGTDSTSEDNSGRGNNVEA